MSLSKCQKCDSGMFEVVENSPSGSNFKIMFIQCSSCGTVIGTTDYYNVGSLLKDQEEQINNLNSRLSNVENSINQLVHAIRNS